MNTRVNKYWFFVLGIIVVLVNLYNLYPYRNIFDVASVFMRPSLMLVLMIYYIYENKPSKLLYVMVSCLILSNLYVLFYHRNVVELYLSLGTTFAIIGIYCGFKKKTNLVFVSLWLILFIFQFGEFAHDRSSNINLNIFIALFSPGIMGFYLLFLIVYYTIKRNFKFVFLLIGYGLIMLNILIILAACAYGNNNLCFDNDKVGDLFWLPEYYSLYALFLTVIFSKGKDTYMLILAAFLSSFFLFEHLSIFKTTHHTYVVFASLIVPFAISLLSNIKVIRQNFSRLCLILR